MEVDDTVELTVAKLRKQKRLRRIGIIVVFIVGFLIGYFARKGKSADGDHRKGSDGRRTNTKKQTAEFHKKFQETVDANKLKETLK